MKIVNVDRLDRLLQRLVDKFVEECSENIDRN